MQRVVAFLLATCAVHAHAQTPPSVCALYFNFSHTLQSDAWLGTVSSTGVLEPIANLGKHDDPQGQLTISGDGSGFAFATTDNATA